MTLVL